MLSTEGRDQFMGSGKFGFPTYYLVSQDSSVYAVFNPGLNDWELSPPGELLPPDAKPLLDQDALDSIDAAVDSGALPIVTPTNYLTIGDEPLGARVLDFELMLKTAGTPNAHDIVVGLMDLFKYMPRLKLKDWYDENVRAQVSPDYADGMWAAFIDIFNRSNLEAIRVNGLQPWDYEQQKLDNYYTSLNQEKAQALKDQMDSYMEAFSDPQAVVIMEDYKTLTPLGDIGLEISRQASLKALIQQKAYDEARGLIEAFRYMSYTDLADAMTKPLPADVVMPDGQVFQKTT